MDGIFDWLLALEVASFAIMFIPGIGTAVGAAIKVALVATRLITTAVRTAATSQKVTAVVNTARSATTKAVSATKELLAENNIIRIGKTPAGNMRLSLGA